MIHHRNKKKPKKSKNAQIEIYEQQSELLLRSHLSNINKNYIEFLTLHLIDHFKFS